MFLYIDTSRLQQLALEQVFLSPNCRQKLVLVPGALLSSLGMLLAVPCTMYVTLKKLPFPSHHLNFIFFFSKQSLRRLVVAIDTSAKTPKNDLGECECL